MSLVPLYNWKRKLGILLFLFGQVVSVAHASEFGTAPHEHDGVECVAILTDDHDGLIPATALIAPALMAQAIGLAATTSQVPPALPRAIRPPATGPPSI